MSRNIRRLKKLKKASERALREVLEVESKVNADKKAAIEEWVDLFEKEGNISDPKIKLSETFSLSMKAKHGLVKWSMKKRKELSKEVNSLFKQLSDLSNDKEKLSKLMEANISKNDKEEFKVALAEKNLVEEENHDIFTQSYLTMNGLRKAIVDLKKFEETIINIGDILKSFKEEISYYEDKAKKIIKGSFEILKMRSREEIHIPMVFIGRAMNPFYYGVKILNATLGLKLFKDIFAIDRPYMSNINYNSFCKYIAKNYPILKLGVITIDYHHSGHQDMNQYIEDALRINGTYYKDWFRNCISIKESASGWDSGKYSQKEFYKKIGLLKKSEHENIGEAINTVESIGRKYYKVNAEEIKGEIILIRKKIFEEPEGSTGALAGSNDFEGRLLQYYIATKFNELLQIEAIRFKSKKPKI